MKKVINRFVGPYRFLSNFWPCLIVLDDEPYSSVEHAYQAGKTNDENWRRRVQMEVKAGGAKRLGRKVPLRPDWEEVKVEFMLSLLRQKFNEPKLMEQLLSTRDSELIEGNDWHDYYWGVCNGRGENWLGKLLMRVREELG